MRKTWCIPPKANAEFACAMEDVLSTYSRDFDEDTVLVCLDEASKQQVRETRTPLPPLPGKPAGHDYEYERNGTANMFMIHAPLLAWRHVEVTDRRTRQDFARVLRDIAVSFRAVPSHQNVTPQFRADGSQVAAPGIAIIRIPNRIPIATNSGTSRNAFSGLSPATPAAV